MFLFLAFIQDGGSRRYGAAGGNAPVNGNRFVGQSMLDERCYQQQQQNYETSDASREAQFFYTRDMLSDNSRRLLFTPQYFDPDLLKV